MDSDFCILPWIELQLTPYSVKTCCAQQGFLSEEPKQGFNQIFNNGPAKDLRRQFLQGKVPAGCSECVEQSRNSGTYKTVKSPAWSHYREQLISNTTPDGFVDAPIRFLDLRFSNLCNFACRTCDSFSSSRWTSLDRKLGRGSLSLKRWDEDPQVMKGIIDALPQIEEIYFAGGEPLLIDGHYQVLDWLIENKRTNIKLSYNTNLSVTSFKGKNIDDYWRCFKQVDVYPSMDSIGPQGEYIRQGFKWTDIEKNMILLKPYLRGPHAVASVYNVFSILDQILWSKRVLQMDTHIFNLYQPLYMAITILPDVLKSQIKDRYLSFIEEHKALLGTHQISKLQEVLSYLQIKAKPGLSQEFKRVNEVLDQHWNRSFKDTFPELADWYGSL